MNRQNIKKVYVINLDRTRITILSGILIASLGGTFLTGLKFRWPVENSTINQSTQLLPDEAIPKELPVKLSEEKILSLPEEDNQIFANNSDRIDDPFLNDPPQRFQFQLKKRDKKEVENTDVKNSVKPLAKSVSKSSNTEKEGIFYTVQVGAFAHEKDANELVKDLKKKGVDARVDKGTLYYFVRTGKASRKEALEPVYQKLTKKIKLNAIIIQKKIS
jgi:cell division septation protein DedD